MIIRATPDHRADIWYVAERAKEYQPEMEIDRDKIDKMIDLWFAEGDDKSVILLAYSPEYLPPVGCIVGRAEEHLWHKGRMALECLWWTDRKHPEQAKHLIGAFEYWGKRVGCTHTLLTAAVNTDINAVSRAYRRKNYTEIERSFIKDL